jgi:hypothetical protein
MGATLREVVGECLRPPLVLPYLIHYKPQARRREQIDAKDHWTSVTPDFLTKEFRAHAYNHVPAGERPTFHEIRARGMAERAVGFPTGVHSGVDGARGPVDDEALSGRARRKEDRVPGGWRRIGVLRWSFAKVLQIADNKKGLTFR